MTNNLTCFSKEQKRAITFFGAPLMVIAGPGSGKTTVITERIKYLIESAGVSPADILVITFTRAAAREMEARFKRISSDKYQVRFGTFHSVFYWILKTAYNINSSSIISEEDKRIIVEKLIFEQAVSYDNKEDIVTSVISQISYVKCDMIDVDNYYSRDMPEKMFRQIYHKLNETLKRQGKLDFDDMMVMCYELITKRNDILNQLRSIFKYILIDEFQDSNKLQYEIIKLIAMPANNITIVGDDDQSVYGFRGARPEIMQQFKRDFKNTQEIILGRNYRCDRWITECSAAVIANNRNRFKKKLYSESENNGVVKVISPRDSVEANDLLVKMIRQRYSEGVCFENQAVIYRTNIQPRRLVYKLNQNGIPFTITDTLPNIFQHFAVRNVLDYMHIACGDYSRSRFLRIINKPGRYISRELLKENPVDIDMLRYRLRYKEYIVERLDKLYADLRLLAKLKPFAACNFIRKFIGYDEYLNEYAEYTQLDAQEFYEVLDEFAFMIKDLSSYNDLFSFIEEYTELLGKQKDESKEHKGVKLMTMHGSKGLEFDCVYIIDAVEDIVPYKKAKSMSELEEERRMFYVAMTRARHELYIFAPRNTNGKDRAKSRYVQEIEDYLLDKNKQINNRF